MSGQELADAEVIAHNVKFDALWLRVKCGLRASKVFCTLTAARLLAAGEFTVYRSLHLMVGAATNPSLISAGASVGSKTLKATAAVSRNIDLGTTSAFGVEVGW